MGQTVRAEGVPIGTTVSAIVGSSHLITLSAATTARLPNPTELIFTSTTCSDGTTSAVAACYNGWFKTGAYVAGVSSEACTACTAVTNAQTTYCAGATATQALLCNDGYYISGTYSSPTASDTCETCTAQSNCFATFTQTVAGTFTQTVKDSFTQTGSAAKVSG